MRQGMHSRLGEVRRPGKTRRPGRHESCREVNGQSGDHIGLYSFIRIYIVFLVNF